MNAITLPPDLEQFAADVVAAGRFGSTAEVVEEGVKLLRQREEARAQLLASVLAAEEEAARTGYLTCDEVATHVRQTIARKIDARNDSRQKADGAT